MESQKTANVVKITTGDEHRLLDNQKITDQNSLMYSAFNAALIALDGIVKSTDRWNDQRRNRNRSDDQEIDEYYVYSNNILAFCAPRGQGKTSAMLSFSRAITCVDTTQEKDTKLAEILQNYNFYALPPIDPTMLNEGESVIQLVLGKLFQEISNLWEDPQKMDFRQNILAQKETEKYQILEDLKTCYHGLSRINKQSVQEKDMDDFEKLFTVSDIFHLKKRIHKIILYFFQLLGYPPEKSFLFIQLDDTDMQMNCAYSVLEEVRKYLAMPNVVVLMATHLDQLRTLITQQYAAQLKSAYHDQAELDKETHRMTAKYLDKLIPASQTIHLPTMRLRRDTESELKLVVKNAKGDSEEKELENEIFLMIYKKTGLAFIRHDNYMHNLLPSTLRGLQHLYRLLNQMESPKKPETIEFVNYDERKAPLPKYYREILAYLHTQSENLFLFENYFLSDWCNSKLNADDWTWLKKIDNTASIRRLHYTVQLLQEKFGQSLKNIPQNKQEKKSYFVQLIWFLGQKAKQCITEDEYLLLSALETYFSIQLNKLAIVDQIASIKNIFNPSSRNDMSDESPFLYKFQKLIVHLYDGCETPEMITMNDLNERFNTLISTLNQNRVNKMSKENVSQQNDEESQQILELFLQLFCLGNLSASSQNVYKNVNDLQEYAVYFCCNLDVLAQILKKSADFTAQDTETLPQYFERLKEEIVIKKNTLAYPFSREGKLTFYSRLENLFEIKTHT